MPAKRKNVAVLFCAKKTAKPRKKPTTKATAPKKTSTTSKKTSTISKTGQARFMAALDALIKAHLKKQKK